MAVDDLWHAAINGRGKYFSAADPEEPRDAGLVGAAVTRAVLVGCAVWLVMLPWPGVHVAIVHPARFRDPQFVRCWKAGVSPQNFDLFSAAALRVSTSRGVSGRSVAYSASSPGASTATARPVVDFIATGGSSERASRCRRR